MPKTYVRVNPRSQINSRHRCAMAFSRDWQEIDVDDATRAALEEDPYLEVSETPTVLVEVAATVQSAAGVESAESSGVDEQPTDRGPASDAAEALATGDDITTGETAPVIDAADGQSNNGEKSASDLRIEAIKAGIAKLDPNNAEHWLKDGRPSTIALRDIAGVVISSAERDAVWDELLAERSAG